MVGGAWGGGGIQRNPPPRSRLLGRFSRDLRSRSRVGPRRRRRQNPGAAPLALNDRWTFGKTGWADPKGKGGVGGGEQTFPRFSVNGADPLVSLCLAAPLEDGSSAPVSLRPPTEPRASSKQNRPDAEPQKAPPGSKEVGKNSYTRSTSTTPPPHPRPPRHCRN